MTTIQPPRIASVENATSISLPRGLSLAEVRTRTKLGQMNTLPTATTRTYAQIAFNNIFTFYNNVLFGLGITLIVMGQGTDTLVVVGVVLVNVVVSVVQELRAKYMLDHIALLTRPRTTVVRDGQEITVVPENVVLGDVVLVHAGDQFVADGPILLGQGAVDESLLTGESDVVSKQHNDLVYSGTFCASGTLYYQAEHIGAQSNANKLAQQARAFRQKLTPLQREVNLVIQILLLVGMFYEILVLGNAVIEHLSPLATIQRSVVVMSIIPVGLFLSITVAYALGAVRMVGHGALIQQTNAIESLSHVDVLCLDKTGTLTANTLAIEALFPITGDTDQMQRLLASFTASVTSHTKTTDAIAEAYPGKPQELVHEVSFTSLLKWSAATLRENGTDTTYVLGAPEMLFPALDATHQANITQQMAPLTERGLRILLFATSDVALSQGVTEQPQLPAQLKLLGLIALTDTLRPESQKTLKEFAKEGVQIKIISGDNPETVAAVARQAGITDTQLISGTELATMDETQFSLAAEQKTIFGRITPQQKEHLVKALRQQGHYVAMIGDGVNDVLSLKQAQVGIAMQSGSQATRSVADIILLKDTFSSLPQAFSEGQRIRNGLHHVVILFMARTIFVALMLIAVVVMTDSFAFTPKQNSLLAFITGGIPAIALAVWTKPRRRDHGNLFHNVLHFSLPASLCMSVTGIGIFVGYYLFLDTNVQQSAQTALTDFGILCGLVLMLYVVPLRRFWAVREPVEGDLRPVVLTGGLLVLFFAILAVPALRRFFELASLSPIQSLVLVALVLFWTICTHLVWRFQLLERFLRLKLTGTPSEQDTTLSA